MPAPDEPQEEPVDAEAVEESKPAGADLVVSDIRDPVETFVVLDRHDEEQILEEMQRRALKVMLYDFPMDGTRTVDLSYQGVNECVRQINATGKARIGIDRDAFGGRGFEVETLVEDFGDGPEECWSATVFAREEHTGYGQFGHALQPKRMKLKRGGYKSDPFAKTKAINKAQRNALKVMIPEQIRQVLIAQYRGDAAAIRKIQAGPGAQKLAELGPPLTDDRARELKGRIEALYLEIRELDPLLVLPGEYHEHLTRAETDHAVMERMIGWLEGKLELAKNPPGEEPGG